MPATPPTSPRDRARYQEHVSHTLGSPKQRRTPTPSTSAMPPPPPPRQSTTYNGNVYTLPSNLAVGVHNLPPMSAPLRRRHPSIPAPPSVSVSFYFYTR